MKTGLAARRALWAAIGVGVALMASSVPAVSKPEPTPANILTEDSRTMAVVRIGTPVEIRLRAQAGTGFSWVPTRSDNYLTEMKPLRGARARPGGTQFQRFRFQANRTGTYRLTFSYDQPWRGGTKGARTKNFMIVVR